MTGDAALLRPLTWSFSALRDARECPLRWSLRQGMGDDRARAAGGGHAASGIGLVRGRVCHAVLQRMLDVHRIYAGPRWGSPELVAFWRRHTPQGVIGLVREEAARELRRTLGAADVSRETRLRREVDEAVPSLAASIGALLRLTLSRAVGADRPTTFAEVPVDAEIAPGIRWRGRIDAVVVSGGSVTLLDFKTGAPSPHDAEQLAAYACLFERDERTRGWGSVRRLAVLYVRGGVDERDAPTGPALDAERARLARECAEVSRRLEASPPEASPSPEHCPRCDVRGRCDPYWGARQTWGDGAPHVARSIDVELSVIDVLEGERGLVADADGQSWFVRLDASHAEVVRGLRRGSRIRLMGVVPQAPRGFDDERSADVMVDVGPGCVSVSRP